MLELPNFLRSLHKEKIIFLKLNKHNELPLLLFDPSKTMFKKKKEKKSKILISFSPEIVVDENLLVSIQDMECIVNYPYRQLDFQIIYPKISRIQTKIKQLFKLCSDGDLSILQTYVEKNLLTLNYFDPTHGGSLLHFSSMYGHIEISEYLLKEKISVNLRSKNGSTPLHWAAGANQIEMCKFLIYNGANLGAQTITWNRNIFGKSSGQTAYHWAAESGYNEVMNVLTGYNLIPILYSDEHGRTPLQLAKSESNLNVVSQIEKILENETVIKLRINPFNE